jgi:hypothetical protein
MSKTYKVVEGFTVYGKKGGELISEDEIGSQALLDGLVGSGRLILAEPVKSSATIKKVNDDTLKGV